MYNESSPTPMEDASYRGRVIAHRGRSSGGPENVTAGLETLPSWVAGVEIDVRLTADGVAVLMHDETVDRTTDGSGEVAEMGYDRFRSLTGQQGSPLTSLVEYLAACEGRGFSEILVDIKAPGVELFKAVTEVVSGSRVADVCTLLVRKPQPMEQLKRVANGLRLGMYQTSVKNIDERLTLAAMLGIDLLMLRHGDHRYFKHREVIPKIKADGVRAGASTVNTAEALATAVEDGCDVILTDSAETLGHLYKAVPLPGSTSTWPVGPSLIMSTPPPL